MKRLLYFLIPALFVLVAPSCSRDYDDDYMGNVDERLKKTMAGYQKALADHEYGWIATVSTSEGFYRFYMEFTSDNRVTMTTENLYYEGFDNKPMTSSYRFVALQRPTLIFDTYSYLSIICDPDNDVSQGSGNQGLETDFEYEVEKFENGVFTLVGRTHRAAATLRKATEEEYELCTDPERGLISVFDTFSEYLDKGFSYIETNNGVVKLSLSHRVVSAGYIAPDGLSVHETDTVNTTIDMFSRDIELDKTLVVDQTEITGFVWNGEGYDALLSGDSKLPVKVMKDDPIPFSVYFGPEAGKKYNMVWLNPSLINSVLPASNKLLPMLKQYSDEMKAAGFSFVQIAWQLLPKSGASGKYYLELYVIFGSGGTNYGADYGYDITFDAAGNVKLGNHYNVTVPGNNQMLLDKGVGLDLVKAFDGKTFVRKSAGKFSGRDLGALVDVNDPDFSVIGLLDKQ